GVEKDLPVKTRKKSTKHVDLLAAVLKTDDGKFLIRKRPSKGLLANLWEFPTVEDGNFMQMRTALANYLEEEVDASVLLDTGIFTKVDHVFSHLTWSINVFAGSISGDIEVGENYLLVTKEELEEYAFPVSHQTIWKTYKEKVKL